MTESIIVYRNPLEKAIWEGEYAGVIFPVIVSMCVFMLLFLTLNWIYTSLPKRFKISRKFDTFVTYSNITVSGVIALVILKILLV